MCVEVTELRSELVETDDEHEPLIAELGRIRRANAVFQIEQKVVVDRILFVGEAVLGIVLGFRAGPKVFCGS